MANIVREPRSQGASWAWALYDWEKRPNSRCSLDPPRLYMTQDPWPRTHRSAYLSSAGLELHFEGDVVVASNIEIVGLWNDAIKFSISVTKPDQGGSKNNYHPVHVYSMPKYLSSVLFLPLPNISFAIYIRLYNRKTVKLDFAPFLAICTCAYQWRALFKRFPLM
jgi:hypothetical protein